MLEDRNIKQLHRQLLHHARSLGCSREDAADIVQDVLLKVCEKELLEITELAYLKTMVKNQMINWKKGCAHKVQRLDILVIEAQLPDNVE